MNLFRSEQHARRWHEWDEEMSWALHPVAWWAETFGMSVFRNRGRPDFLTWLTGHEGDREMALLRLRLAE
ncbi:MAG: hypothetical protein VX823_07060 [Actinomycetota bacterium]|nr:hypothetical protein [Acidimicrobiales bacterium]MEC7874222.1 hypothetical protein [Actinomycetota bacterium]MEC8922517.1 hypothetical protein [Actinomycetota bacterium]MEC9270422.1 hypothetical protein [Actinomycetota bacterium]MEC9316622.1 hypothetical protein [Actinomycetota bacterium]